MEEKKALLREIEALLVKYDQKSEIDPYVLEYLSSEELKKIKRVMGKKLAGAPHEVLLVIDATTGQNGINQARLFDDAVTITGMALTKLDGTSKGGIVANICREIKVPIRFIGIGEQMDDLRDFNADEFTEALFQSDTRTVDE